MLRQRERKQQPIEKEQPPGSTFVVGIEQELGQLQAQFHAIPQQQGDDYRFSLDATRRFTRQVIADLSAWLDTTALVAETMERTHGKHR